MKSITASFTTLFILSACAHHRDVRPGDKGVHSVLVEASNKQEGSRDAIKQARNYCEQFEKQAVFLKESRRYTGDMKERDYKNAKRGAKVAQSIGALAGIGHRADSVIGQGYTVSMKFRCR
jgi:hypothetical protein